VIPQFGNDEDKILKGADFGKLLKFSSQKFNGYILLSLSTFPIKLSIHLHAFLLILQSSH